MKSLLDILEFIFTNWNYSKWGKFLLLNGQLLFFLYILSDVAFLKLISTSLFQFGISLWSSFHVCFTINDRSEQCRTVFIGLKTIILAWFRFYNNVPLARLFRFIGADPLVEKEFRLKVKDKVSNFRINSRKKIIGTDD